MQTPIYVIYELLIRLQEINPSVGEYLSSKNTTNGMLIKTTTGNIEIPKEMLSRQFNDPSTITPHQLLTLLDGFNADWRI